MKKVRLESASNSTSDEKMSGTEDVEQSRTSVEYMLVTECLMNQRV